MALISLLISGIELQAIGAFGRFNPKSSIPRRGGRWTDSAAVDMAEVAAGIELIAHPFFQFLDLGKASIDRSVPENEIIVGDEEGSR